MLDRLRSWSRLPMLVRRTWPVLLALLLVIGVADQTSRPPSYAATRAEFRSDDVFVRAVERRIGKNAMVFQLPYNPYPEVAGSYDMDYYDEARGYLHSKTLRWSFGAVRGRYEADWQVKVVAGTVPDLIDTVAALGFSGIYIDRFGYEKRAADPVEIQVARASNEKPVVSPNHRLVLYDIRALGRSLRAKDPQRVAALRRRILRGTRND
jgi:phosphoglycerol transferase